VTRSELHVSLELDETELAQLREHLGRGAALPRSDGEEELVRTARERLRAAQEECSLRFVARSLERLELMADMLEDKDWVLPGSVGPRIRAVLRYVVNPGGLVPDANPTFGFLDDAVLIEILAQDLRHELEGYRDFCHFREGLLRRRSGASDDSGSEHALVLRRKRLRARIQGRQYRDADRRKGRWGILRGLRRRIARSRAA
jgi:uncharacterized membrane protein YkvA (DUF1232 family)